MCVAANVVYSRLRLEYIALFKDSVSGRGGSVRCKHANKLLIVKDAVPVLICLLDQHVHLLLGQFVA